MPPDRREAERQDFTAGTIFAAGAMGVLAEHCPDPAHALNAFVILLDPVRTFGVEPALRRLFEVAEGKPDAPTAGAVSWSALGGRDPLVKLKLRLTRPVRARVEFLLLADNYTALWPAVTRDHVLALALSDRLPTPDSAGTELSQVLARSVIIPTEPSATIAELIKVQGWTEPAPPVTLIRELPDAEADDVAYWLFVAQDTAGGRQAVAAWMHSGVSADVLDPGGRNRDGLVDYWVRRGLRRGGPRDLLHPADGWTASLDHSRGTFQVIGGDGDLALSGTFDPVRDADWVDVLTRTGELVVLTGRLAPEGETMTGESLQAAVAGGDVARGIVALAG